MFKITSKAIYQDAPASSWNHSQMTPKTFCNVLTAWLSTEEVCIVLRGWAELCNVSALHQTDILIFGLYIMFIYHCIKCSNMYVYTIVFQLPLSSLSDISTYNPQQINKKTSLYHCPGHLCMVSLAHLWRMTHTHSCFVQYKLYVIWYQTCFALVNVLGKKAKQNMLTC